LSKSGWRERGLSIRRMKLHGRDHGGASELEEFGVFLGKERRKKLDLAGD